MAQRYDIGDNSMYLDVASSSTLAQISVLLDNFLAYKGWTKIESVSVSATLQKYTYSCINLNGSVKRISVYVQGTPASGLLRLGVSVHSDTLPTEQGMTLAIAQDPDNVSNLARWIVLRQVSGNCQLYVFSSQRWCLFMSSVITSFTFAPGHTKAGSWDGSSTYYYYTATKPVVVPQTPVGNNPNSMYLPGYNSENGVTEYIYIGTRTLPNSATFHKRGAIGCVEFVNSQAGFPVAYVDTSTLFMVMPEESNVDYLHKYLMTRNTAQNIGYTAYSGELGVMKPCNLRSDASDYMKVVTNPWNSKSFTHEIQLAHKLGYAGKLLGLKVAAAKAAPAGSELIEANIKVDANYDFDANGVRRKFFRIPGYSRFFGAYPRCKFNYNANREIVQRSIRYDNQSMWLTAFVGNSMGTYELESTDAFDNIYDCGFLIPA